MDIAVVGLSHQRAPIEIREQLAIADSDLAPALALLRSVPQLQEAAILSTCNRVELYAVAHPSVLPVHLRDMLAATSSRAGSDFESYLYTLTGIDAVNHLMSVAAGLDSLVLGEPQILRQVRDAFDAAVTAQAAGPVLNGLFRAAIAAGKRARTETGIGSGGFSVGHAAVDLARSIFGSLDHAAILILGAGKMSELTARHLKEHGIRAVMVANRTHDRALALAQRLGGEAIHYEAFPEALITADIVIGSTASPHPVVTRALVQPLLRRRRGRPLFFIDIAVPRDIAPDVAPLDNVFVYDMDDLQMVVADMARGREAEADQVKEIIAEESSRFMAWARSLTASPTITSIKHAHETSRAAELQRLRRQLPHLTAEEWSRIDAASRSMMNRVTKNPIARLKAAAAGEEAGREYSLLDAAHELFGLNPAEDILAEPEDYEAGSGMAGASHLMPPDSQEPCL